MTDVLSEILKWSHDQPSWQRDALRRLLTSGNLSDEDIGELTAICESAHGLSDKPHAPKPLEKQHLATKAQKTRCVSLTSITHHRGVNALAPEQTVTFGPNLTVVYGRNAAGKSGYTRILKRVCRSRGVEDVLGNVLSGDVPLKPEATIRFRENGKDVPFDWSSDVIAPETLAAVSVFDSFCAPVYLRDKTDVAFRPFGLDVFDRLSAACGAVKSLLEAEQLAVSRMDPKLPDVPEGTRVKALLDGLTTMTKTEVVQGLATLSKDEDGRLKELRSQQRDSQVSDPKRLGRDLSLKAERIGALVRHIEGLAQMFGDANLSRLRSAAESVLAARRAVALIRKAAFTPDLLSGTGEDAWQAMWEAAGEFSQIAYPETTFPVLAKGARCLLCQQILQPDAAARLKHFAEYITSEGQIELSKAEEAYSNIRSPIIQMTVKRKDITAALSEIDEDEESTERVKEFLEEVGTLQKAITNADGTPKSLPVRGIQTISVSKLKATVEALQKRAGQLQLQKSSFDPKLVAELNELEARTILKKSLQAVLNEIERKKRLSAYRQCLDDTATQSITRKSTELTKKLVTDQLKKTFQEELRRLEFKHLAVEIQVAGGAKGALYHHLVFSNAPSVNVTAVLSEGESRALSLAAFLTELSTASTGSAIIFDDPVSSLDHIWRKRIAHRLVAEAAVRQVVVFTHDLLFLRLLIDESDHQKVSCQHQYIRRDAGIGICSADLPWIAMNVKDRVGRLRSLWQSAEKLQRTSTHEAYEAEAHKIYGLLREAWEQAVSEVLLNDVVERYRPSIETQKVRVLHDITEADCEVIEDGMTECSRWMFGHDEALADGTPFPSPKDLQQRINDLDDWVKAVRKRREGKKNPNKGS